PPPVWQERSPSSPARRPASAAPRPSRWPGPGPTSPSTIWIMPSPPRNWRGGFARGGGGGALSPRRSPAPPRGARGGAAGARGVGAELGRIDVYVANAAYSDEDWFWQADLVGFRRTVDVTLWGAYHGLRACAGPMIRQGGGAVVVVSSPHARIAFPRCMAYNM